MQNLLIQVMFLIGMVISGYAEQSHGPITLEPGEFSSGILGQVAPTDGPVYEPVIFCSELEVDPLAEMWIDNLDDPINAVPAQQMVDHGSRYFLCVYAPVQPPGRHLKDFTVYIALDRDNNLLATVGASDDFNVPLTVWIRQPDDQFEVPPGDTA